MDAAILAGGASRRMGRDKAAVEVGGRSMLETVASALVRLADLVLVVGREEAPPGLVPVPDPPGGHFRGPLAGLVAGLRAAASDHLLVVAVDQPWVRRSTLASLSARAGPLPLVPVVDGIRQTTCAVYPRQVLPVAEEELEGGGSIQSMLDRAAFEPVLEGEWRRWGEDGRSWFSADTLEALHEGLNRFGAPGGREEP